MKFKKDILHKKVKIKATGEIAYIVWYDEHPEHDSFLLDLAERDELPLFYEFDDFIFLEEQTMQIFCHIEAHCPTLIMDMSIMKMTQLRGMLT